MRWKGGALLLPMCFILLACEASSSTSSTGGNSSSTSPSAKLPDDVCAVLASTDLDAILSPAAGPFAAGHPTTAVSGATSKGCEWLSGPPAGDNSIGIVAIYAFYNPNTPVSTAGFETVSGLGTDTAYFATNKYGQSTMKARKNGVVVNLQMSKKEAHDAALAHTRAITEKLLAKV
jgi:hypothetical protein